MVKNYGWRPSGGAIPSRPTQKRSPNQTAGWIVPLASTAEDRTSSVSTENTKDVMRRAVYITLSHVRGADLPRDVAELLTEESARSEIIFRVGQALGPLGLKGAELATAHETLARLLTTAEEVLATPELPDQTGKVG